MLDAKSKNTGSVGQFERANWLWIDGCYRSMLANGQALMVQPEVLWRSNLYVAKLLLLTDHGWQTLVEHSDSRPEQIAEADWLAARPLVGRAMEYAESLYPGLLRLPTESSSACKQNSEIWLEAEGALFAQLSDGRSLMIQTDQLRCGNQFDARLMVLTETGWACQQELTAIKPHQLSNEEFIASMSITNRLMDLAKFLYPDGLAKPVDVWQESDGHLWQWSQQRLHYRLPCGKTLMIVPEQLHCGSDYVARLFLLSDIWWKQLLEVHQTKPAKESVEDFVGAMSLSHRLMRFTALVYQG
ncbi:MAG: hypothetical protein IPP97_11355 [Candidatus Obscuribacter sp.]|nr:hypothetical protein [Candidatus Obscuribacter sp.]